MSSLIVVLGLKGLDSSGKAEVIWQIDEIVLLNVTIFLIGQPNTPPAKCSGKETHAAERQKTGTRCS